MSLENVFLQVTDGIAMIVLNHPPANTLSEAVLTELTTVFTAIEKNNAARAVVLTGAGEKFFSGGADIKELRTAEVDEYVMRGQTLFRQIETLSKPVIAAINGFALGGGCELIMSCHIRYAADTAKLGQTEINLGILPGWGATQRLPRLVGRGRALELLLTGHVLSATEAERIGLVNHVVPAAELKEAALKLARRLADAAPLAVRGILECVDVGLTQGFQKGLDAERDTCHWVDQSEDARIGIQAFLTKQKPEFKGR